MKEDEKIQNDIEIIKKILIIQLVQSGISIRDIVKITGMSSKTLYQFIPKNIGKTKNS